MTASTDYSPNLRAFLDMIAFSEGTSTVKGSDDGYNVMVGGTLFTSYADHPRKVVELRPGLASTAAGRYQLLTRYWDFYRAKLGLVTFHPVNQDAVAVQQIRESKAKGAVEAGDISDAVLRCSRIWASLPGAGYGQRENKMAALLDAYAKARAGIT